MFFMQFLNPYINIYKGTIQHLLCFPSVFKQKSEHLKFLNVFEVGLCTYKQMVFLGAWFSCPNF